MTNANEKRPTQAAREAAEAATCANHRDDIGALLDMIGQQAKSYTHAATLEGMRASLIEIVAGSMYHLFGNSEVATREAIEDNLASLRESRRYRVDLGNGKSTTVSIPPREE